MTTRKYIRIILTLLVSLAAPAPAPAGLKSEAVEQGSRFILRRFGVEVSKELGDEGEKVLARKLEVLASKYGEEEAVTAAKKVGPQIFRVVEEAGEEGAPMAVKLMSRTGDEAIWVVARKRSMAIFLKFGDDAADAMIKHKEIAEPVIEQFGLPAARALKATGGQNARRLAMMAQDGELAKLGRCDELLETIGRRGDAAMDWIWRNKGALATSAVLAKFLQDPQPFIDGTIQIARVGGEAVVRPVSTEVARGISARTNWTLVISLLIVTLAVFYAARSWMKYRQHIMTMSSAKRKIAPSGGAGQ